MYNYLFRSYQKQLSRTTAEKGEECISVLTGPERELHTAEIAKALNVEDVLATKDDEVEITVPQITIISDDTTLSGTSSEDTSTVAAVMTKMTDPVVVVKPIGLKENGSTSLVAIDDIEVKKEELEEPKKVSFTEEEDKYLRDGCKKYDKSVTKWADILKDPGYKFHPTRKRDTLRCRAKTLKADKRGRRSRR